VIPLPQPPPDKPPGSNAWFNWGLMRNSCFIAFMVRVFISTGYRKRKVFRAARKICRFSQNAENGSFLMPVGRNGMCFGNMKE
jgi:hypothetical protein